MTKGKITTSSLEKSGELPYNADPDDVSSPYGKALSETITTHVVFEKGELIIVQRDGKTLTNKFYPRTNPHVKESER